MIFINNAIREIGWEGLIVSLKSKEFFVGRVLQKEDFQRLFTILTDPTERLNISDSMRDNLILVYLFNEMEDNNEAIEQYMTRYGNIPINQLQKQGSDNEKLYFWFNIIEIELKYHKRPASDFKKIYNQMIKFNEKEKRFEEFILLSYYFAVIKLMFNDFQFVKKNSLNIILEISKLDSEASKKNDFILFIELKNLILNIKALEMDSLKGNKLEILNNLECLFENAKIQNESFAVQLGLKMNSILTSSIDYTASAKLLNEILNILHQEMIYGKAKSSPIEQFLYVSAFLGYCYTIIGNTQQIPRCIKKLDKTIMMANDIQNDIKRSHFSMPELTSQFSFFSLILKKHTDIKKAILNQEEKEIITKYKSYLNSTLREKDDAIINIYVLNKYDNAICQYFNEKEIYYYQAFSNKKIEINDNQLLYAYLYMYNAISSLTQCIINDPNQQKQLEYLLKIRNYSDAVIKYTNEKINNNDILRTLFKYNYFKEMFNKIYYCYCYTFLFQKNYKEVITIVDIYTNLIKFQYELAGEKNHYKVIQLKGDALMKLGKFIEAADVYFSIVDHAKNKALVCFNLGLCSFIINDKAKAKSYLTYAKDQYKDNPEKKNIIDKIFANFN